jgi:hypothetical protein
MSNQLDVHTNPGRNKALVPFVVVVQSNQFRESARRVVVPLVAAEAFGAPNSDVAVASLTGEDDRVVRTLDILLSRAWR